MKIITILALVLTLSACSMSDSKREQTVVHNDDLEFAVDTLADNSPVEEFKVEEQKITESVIPDEYQAPPVEETAMTAPVEPTFEEFKKPEEKVEEFLADKPVEIPKEMPTVYPSPASESKAVYSDMESYRVQKGDTLMLVAFKIYGDYRKWKDIKAWNNITHKLVPGTDLKYQVPETAFGWSPNGLPYLVKGGDTLQLISLDKYKTRRKWRAIYENNRPLIRNPDLIFAGFTLYYEPTRELASEKK